MTKLMKLLQVATSRYLAMIKVVEIAQQIRFINVSGQDDQGIWNVT